LLAHKYLGLSFIDAIIKNVDDKTADILKVEENLRRKDVNPVDEAIYI
jgi:ParB-like chromosome segregation protein Spo0J